MAKRNTAKRPQVKSLAQKAQKNIKGRMKVTLTADEHIEFLGIIDKINNISRTIDKKNDAIKMNNKDIQALQLGNRVLQSEISNLKVHDASVKADSTKFWEKLSTKYGANMVGGAYDFDLRLWRSDKAIDDEVEHGRDLDDEEIAAMAGEDVDVVDINDVDGDPQTEEKKLN